MAKRLPPRLRGGAQPRKLAAASPSGGGLLGLERRALFVFVGRWREVAAVKRARLPPFPRAGGRDSALPGMLLRVERYLGTERNKKRSCVAQCIRSLLWLRDHEVARIPELGRVGCQHFRDIKPAGKLRVKLRREIQQSDKVVRFLEGHFVVGQKSLQRFFHGLLAMINANV
jgi:hypothetical protein